MDSSPFAEFQYFIRRINALKAGKPISKDDTLDDLEKRFHRQVERGLVLIDPDQQEMAMKILLAPISDARKVQFITELRRTGKTKFRELGKLHDNPKPVTKADPNTVREQALDLMVAALTKAGVRVKRQPLGMKMLYAAHDLGPVDYQNRDDLKLLFVNTIKYSGHVKKAAPEKLATIFNQLVARADL